MTNAKGFTLIEIMIVVAIISIIAVVAIPQYKQYVARGNRAAAQAFMMDIANREKQYLLDARSYTASWSITDPVPTLSMTVPPKVAINYTIAVSALAATPPAFTITATAINAQASDGNLTLDDAGNKTPVGKW